MRTKQQDGILIDSEALADALMAVGPGVLADVLEALGLRTEMASGAMPLLGGELRRLARDLREELGQLAAIVSPVRQKAS